MAVVESLWTTPYAGSHMELVSKIEAVAGKGIGNDRYSINQGTYSVLPEPGRQLTIISADSVEAAFAAHDLKLESLGTLRRNVVVRGVSAETLLEAVGSEIQIGTTCRVFVHRNCVPCMCATTNYLGWDVHAVLLRANALPVSSARVVICASYPSTHHGLYGYNEKKNGVAGLMEALWDCGGVSCEIVSDGAVHKGDELRLLLGSSGGRVPVHSKKESFFIRPSLRTAAMVRDDISGKAAAYARLRSTDAEGVRRAAESYARVGLAFWPQSAQARDAHGGRAGSAGAAAAALARGPALISCLIALGIALLAWRFLAD